MSIRLDDSDPRVHYYPDYMWTADDHVEGLVVEQGTRHGARFPGMQVGLDFQGTILDVVGVLDSRSGQPTILCVLDGILRSYYTAPLPDSTANGTRPEGSTTFFSFNELAPGSHTALLTNINGTSPNIFWLDFFTVEDLARENQTMRISVTLSSPSSGSHPSSRTISVPLSTANSGSPPSSQTIPVVILPSTSSPRFPQAISLPLSTSSSHAVTSQTIFSSTITDVAPVPSVSPLSSVLLPSQTVCGSSSRSRRGNVGAVVGGAIGGFVFLLTINICLWRVLIRRVRALEGTASPVEPSSSMLGIPSSTTVTTGSLTEPESRQRPDLATEGNNPDNPKFPGTPQNISQANPGSPCTTAFSAESSTTVPSASPSALLRSEVVQLPWSIAPDRLPGAQSVFRSFLMARNGTSVGTSRQDPRRAREVDSGLRVYSESVLPPPYTAD
ncbi:hypothetical protein C8Q76DRAFT_322507 [Earliella scabrosa]|nr:hypothetical protein C8Q76DRAFT_322507 [Earliella scabrosa]